jgi:hypothetical protein
MINLNEKRKPRGKKPSSKTGLGRWFREKWKSQSGEECGSYTGEGEVKCRPSKRITGKTPRTWGEMSKEEKQSAVRQKQEAKRKGHQFSSHTTGKSWNDTNESVSFFFNTIKNRLLLESKKKKKKKKKKKPFKGFDPEKNDPEGGLSVSYARKLGIRAGVETKREAERSGGFSKLKGKTKKRQKSFCKRMCGMKKKRTSAKTANDPDSKINAALRVWGCRCG